jgi:rhamnulokinase
MTYYLAVDIGASSGRHILGHVMEGKIILEEIYRFDNLQIRKNGHDCWNVNELFSHIIMGMKACQKAGKIPSFLAVDTWGVDFVLLDNNDTIIGDAVAYRDSRTQGMDKLVAETISAETLYQQTGTQKQLFNTIYQLAALKNQCPQLLEQAESLLMIPDYFHFLLTGVKKQEYTNATTSGLVNACKKEWDLSLIDALGLPRKLFDKLSMPGTVVGSLKPEICKEAGFCCQVILPATHDTGSAFLAVPAKDNQAVYLSSGTWSLLGTETANPITTEESRRANFTNEGGYHYRFRYLKNIMGLWMLQSIRREINGVDYVAGKEGPGKESSQTGNSPSGRELHTNQSEGANSAKITFPDMIALAKERESFSSVVDVDNPCFLSPDSMRAEIKAYCARTNQPVPQTLGEVVQCVYKSLTRRYAESIRKLERLTGNCYTSINIVGGGCQDSYLNKKIAQATGLTVYAGPVEGTALGNLIVQMLHAGEFSDLQQARNAIKQSFEIRRYDHE